MDPFLGPFPLRSADHQVQTELGEKRKDQMVFSKNTVCLFYQPTVVEVQQKGKSHLPPTATIFSTQEVMNHSVRLPSKPSTAVREHSVQKKHDDWISTFPPHHKELHRISFKSIVEEEEEEAENLQEGYTWSTATISYWLVASQYKVIRNSLTCFLPCVRCKANTTHVCQIMLEPVAS